MKSQESRANTLENKGFKLTCYLISLDKKPEIIPSFGFFTIHGLGLQDPVRFAVG